MASNIPELDVRRTALFIKRGLRLRCPQCGEGRMFKPWDMLKRCSSCSLRFDRGEHDYFIGAYTINLIIAELAVAGGLVVGILVTWPNVPWNLLTWVLLPVAILLPLLTFPFSRSLWLAIDLIYQPARESDFTM